MVLAVTGFLVIRYQNDHSEAARWKALSKERRLNVFNRSLPSFETFFHRQASYELRMMFESSYFGYKENYSMAGGLLVEKGQIVGHCGVRFYFHGWEPEPASAEFLLVFNPWVLDKLPDSQLRALALQARTAGLGSKVKTPETPLSPNGGRPLLPNSSILKRSALVRDRLGDIDCVGSVDGNGDIDILLRIPYPCRWMEDIPQYDRGSSDTMRSEIVPRVMSFLEREAFASQWTPAAFELPVFNPPDSVWHVPGGLARGYFRTKEETLVPFEISAGESGGSSRDVIIRLEVNTGHAFESDDPVKSEDVRGLFKPGFLAMAGASATATVLPGGLTLSVRTAPSRFGVTIECPIEYPLETVKLP